jgi:hypothetical protein
MRKLHWEPAFDDDSLPTDASTDLMMPNPASQSPSYTVQNTLKRKHQERVDTIILRGPGLQFPLLTISHEVHLQG